MLLLNTDRERAFTIEAGDRIAQLVIVPVALEDVLEVQELSTAVRGDGGFGSTGVRPGQ